MYPGGMLALATTIQSYYTPPFFLLVAFLIVAEVLFLIGLLIVLRSRREEPSQPRTMTIIVLAIVFALVTGVLGYGAFQVYVTENTWTFSYSVSIGANSTSPEGLVVPVPKDEGLLAGLHLTWGTANWSFVDTPKGRGLYVRFTGSVALEAFVSLFPRPGVLPDTSPTMMDSSNASEFLRLWIFYPGGAGGRLDMSFPSWYLQAFLVPGWTSAGPWPVLPPLA